MGGVTCINDERAAVRDALRALLPLFVFSCHALVVQQWISMKDTADWVHKDADISSIRRSFETKHPIDALFDSSHRAEKYEISQYLLILYKIKSGLLYY